MSEATKNFIDALATGDNVGAGEHFKDALRDKVGSALDVKRQEVAGSIFAQAPDNAQDGATAFSDPKPHVTDPSPTTADIIHTDGSQIEFTPNEAETQ